MELLTLAFAITALLAALAFRPWRLLANSGLVSPLLATLVIVPWLWALPWLHKMPIHLQLSGACMVTLALGWPLAVPALCVAGLIAGWLAPITWEQQLNLTVWLGIVPATLSFGIGMALRRWLPHNLFVYILGRAFLGTVACMFMTGALAQWTGQTLAMEVPPEKIHQIVQAAQRTISLETPIGNEDDTSLGDLIADPRIVEVGQEHGISHDAPLERSGSRRTRPARARWRAR